jgi:glutaredoxin
MTQACPKCSYRRKPADTAPDWQCPSCGIAYAKFQGAQAAPALQTGYSAVQQSAPLSRTFVVAALAVVLALGYFGYGKLAKNGDASRNLSATGGEVHETDNPALVVTMDGGGPVLRLKPEVSAQLAGFTQARVVMFATSWCPYCAQARELFAAQGVSYVEFDIERDHEQARFQKDVLRQSGVPMIVIGNRLVPGFDQQQIAAGLKEL